jgi:hypothetical protein
MYVQNGTEWMRYREETFMSDDLATLETQRSKLLEEFLGLGNLGLVRQHVAPEEIVHEQIVDTDRFIVRAIPNIPAGCLLHLAVIQAVLHASQAVTIKINNSVDYNEPGKQFAGYFASVLLRGWITT